MLVIAVNARHRQNPRILLRRDRFQAIGGQVPIEDSADEWRDQEHAGLGAGQALFDDLGHTDSQPRLNRIHVFEDAPPEVQIAKPTRDLSVTQGSTVPIVVRANDTLNPFLTRFGIFPL